MAKDMRSWLSQLEEAGELERVRDEVSVDVDIGRRLYAEKQKALLFERVKDLPGWRVLGQAPANWRQIGLAFGVEPKDIVREFASRVDKGLVKCKMVSSGPVKEVVWKGKDANLFKVPIHKIADRDPGRFIAGGMNIVKDPETGIRNMAMHRMQVKDSNKTGIFLAPGRHTELIYQKYEKMNKPMPMAVVIGHHPMYYFAAPYTAPWGVDELEVAGALLGEPVELVKCETVDIEAPADAEMVLECEIPPKVREPEGPFSEFTGYYPNMPQPMPVAIVKGISMRKDAIYKAVQSGALTESIFYNGLPMAVAIYRDLKNVGGYADIKSVSSNWGGTFCVVVQMTPRFYGEAKHVLLAAMSSLYHHQKIAIAVDEDIDIYDPQDVAWAIATRVNPEEDICVIPGVRGHPLDNKLPPVDEPGVTTWHRLGSRVLIDATKPPTCNPTARAGFDRAMPPSPK
jgi:2,5-furandicarboxylate decarboxylase 1